MERLQGFYNPAATAYMSQARDNAEVVEEEKLDPIYEPEVQK
jgi:hypothetical protein